MIKKPIEIVKNINSIYSIHLGKTLEEEEKALSKIIATLDHSLNTEYYEILEYSESEKRLLREKAEYDYKNISLVIKNQKLY